MAISKKTASKPKNNGSSQGKKAAPFKRPVWELRLYVAGMTPTSIRAFENLKRLCEEHMHAPIKFRLSICWSAPYSPAVTRLLLFQPLSGVCPLR
jgi:hypothetical protein